MAPRLTSQASGIANPIAEILSGALLLAGWAARPETRGPPAPGRTSSARWPRVLAEGSHLTRDLGGQASTDKIGDTIVETIGTLP